MKKTLLLLALAMGLTTAMAEVNNSYPAPTLTSVTFQDFNAMLYFKAPAQGGNVWEATISNTNPMGTLTASEGNPGFYNSGLNGMVLGSTVGTANFSLTTPAIALEAGNTYTLLYTDAGSRSSQNYSLQVNLLKDGTPVKTLAEKYELQPCTSATNFAYYDHSISLSVTEAGNYAIQFSFTNGGKSAGMFMKNVSVVLPVPEGMGALTGYNIYRDGEKAGQFSVEDAQKGAILYTYEHEDILQPLTLYSFALQAVYEGGESPLSAPVNATTPDIPEGISHATTTTAATPAYNLQGQRSQRQQMRGINIVGGQKQIR